MTITPTALLSLPIITTGTESGTWGDVVDNGLTSYLDIAIAGGLAISITTANVTLAKTAGTSSATGIISTGATGSTAQYAILNISGAMTGSRSLILPSSSKIYVINNSTTGGYSLTVKGAATTGINMRNGESAQVAWNGSDFVKVGPGPSISGTNTAVGADALQRNTTGIYNTAFGNNALFFNSTGNQNSGFGVGALQFTSTGSNNTSMGFNCLDTNSTGSDNTAVGTEALTSSTVSGNTAFGRGSLFTCTTGGYNTAIGAQSGNTILAGSGNIVIGTYSAAGVEGPVFSIINHDNRISMGSTSVTNAYIQVAWTVVSDARDKTDFADVPHGLDFVSKLQPTAYRFKETRDATEGHGPLRYGFKAQDVLALEGDTPVIVDADNPDKLYFNDQALLAVLVNAIKELKAEFDAYKAAHA